MCSKEDRELKLRLLEKKREEMRARRVFINAAPLSTATRDFRILLAVAFGGDNFGCGLGSYECDDVRVTIIPPLQLSKRTNRVKVYTSKEWNRRGVEPWPTVFEVR